MEEEKEGGADNLDPLAYLGDQFLDDDIKSYFEPSIVKSEEEDLVNYEDEETAFCIIPFPQTKENPERYRRIKTIRVFEYSCHDL